MAQQPLINGRQMAWSSVSLVIGGIIIDGITAIKYGVKTTKNNNYGRGSKAVDRTQGNEEPEASITLYFYEVQRIMNALPPNTKISDIPPFDIPVSFQSPDGEIVNHRIIMAEFTEQMLDMKQNDPKIEMVLPLIVGDVKFK